MNVRKLAIAHGIFDVVTGVWPIVSLGTFEAVTGPKLEGWLVKTVGSLIGVVGAGIGSAGHRGRVTKEVAGLAIGSSLALAAIDLWYAGVRRRIAPIYLVDAAVEVGWAIAWGLALRDGLDEPAAEEVASRRDFVSEEPRVVH